VSDDTLAELAGRIEQLRLRLEAGGLDAEEATRVLEEIAQVAQETMEEIERRAERLESSEPPP
jgi:polyhydroxyalkanoate synthesis regulator phasin